MIEKFASIGALFCLLILQYRIRQFELENQDEATGLVYEMENAQVDKEMLNQIEDMEETSEVDENHEEESTESTSGGVPTNNAFFNFVRVVRANSDTRNQREIVRRASILWRTMTSEEKEYFEQLARCIQQRNRKN